MAHQINEMVEFLDFFEAKFVFFVQFLFCVDIGEAGNDNNIPANDV